MVSSKWYTPDWLYEGINKVLGHDYEDPCPTWYVKGEHYSGLDHLEDLSYIGLSYSAYRNKLYVNPPSPAQEWARVCLKLISNRPEVTILYMAFSESVLFQVPELLYYPSFRFRNRISWVDGNTGLVQENPRHYNTMVCMTTDLETVNNFQSTFTELYKGYYMVSAAYMNGEQP